MEDASGPEAGLLAGVRVLDLSRVLAGPFAAQILADMGADVIKVEFPRGDPARRVGPFVDGRSLYFSSVNTGKRGVVVDPATPDGRQLLDDLVATSDIVVSNFRPEAARDLGLTYEHVAAANAGVVLVSLAGYSAASSAANRPAYDLSIQAEAGIMAVTGSADGEPVRAGVPISDLAAGMWGAMGAVSALVARFRTGRGRFIEVPLLDATLPLLSYVGTVAGATGVEPGKVGSGHHSICPYGAFSAADGWLVIAVLADKFWSGLCAALELDLAERPELGENAERVRVRDEIDEAITVALSSLTVAEAMARLERAGVPHAPVNGILDALSTPYVQEQALVAGVQAAQGSYPFIRTPLGTTGSPRPAPMLGEHTDEVAAELAARRPEPPRLPGSEPAP